MTVEWWAIILSSVTGIVCALLVIADTRRGKAQERLHERLDVNDDTTKKQGVQIATLEEHIKHLPTADSIGRLHDKLNDLAQKVSDVQGGQRVLTDLLSRKLTG